MSRRRDPFSEQKGVRDEPTGDQRAEYWASRAKTPQTRARIRRWSRIENIAIGILLVGMALFVLMILVSIALAIWFEIAGIDRDDVYMWGFGIAPCVVIPGAITEIIATGRLDKAKWADADTAIGVVDSVTSRPEVDAEGATATVYRVCVTAQISGGITLCRHLEGGESENGGPDDTWIGRNVRFLHNTLDPSDLSDARFEGWVDETPRFQPFHRGSE